MLVSETVLQQTLQMMHKNPIVWSHTIFTVSITYSGVITVTQRHLMSTRTISMNEVTDTEYYFPAKQLICSRLHETWLIIKSN